MFVALFHTLGKRGGAKCPGQFNLPPPTSVSKVKIFAFSTYFKLSECEDVSIIIIIIIQVKLSCFPHRTVSYAWLQGKGGAGEQVVQGSLFWAQPG